MKKFYSIHHYLGTFFFLLFLIWFLSGFVMMYKRFPFYGDKERIEKHQEQQLDIQKIKHPAVVFKDDHINKIHDFRINHFLKRPVFHLTTTDGKSYARYADNASLLVINEQKAAQLVTQATNNKATYHIEKITELDQWIPRLKYLKHLPVYAVCFEDELNTRVYVSSLNGEIISLTTSSDRFWAWTGAIPHWIYFKDIRIHRTFWVQLVTWLAGLGFLMVVTGIITGLARYKKKPNAKFKRFKNKWYNYHYYFGLVFGLFVCTWVFSGFMSMTPLNWTPSTSLNEENTYKWQQENFTLNSFTEQRWNKFIELVEEQPFKEVSFCLFDKTLFSKIPQEGSVQLSSLNENLFVPTITDYKSIVNSFDTTNQVSEATLLTTYDNYYYSRYGDKRLPIIRLKTPSDVAYYIDPATTEMVYKCATKNRVERWLYHGLHSLDFSFLTSNGILWDIIMIFLLFGGTVVSITATGLGIKFIRRKIRKQLKKQNHG